MAARHAFLVVMDLASVFLFSGIVYGWAPLDEILIHEGFYHDLCPDGVEGPCDAQRTALSRAFTLATTAVSLVALPGGAFVDKCGPILASMVSSTLVILGLIGISLCKVFGTTHFDVFLVSFVIIAVGGSVTMFCGYALPFLFPRRCTLLIELTSCLFDASCIIFPIFKVFYDSGVKFQNLFAFYVGLAVVVYVLLIVAWAMNRDRLIASRSGNSGDGEASAHQSESSSLQSQPIGKQLRTFHFATILLFAAIQVTRSNIYLGVVDLVNAQIGENMGMTSEKVSQLTTIVGLIIPQGWLAVPLIEMSIHRIGVCGTLQITSAVGVLYNALQLVPNMAVQVINAAIFAVFRAFLFSIITAYNAETFGPATLGRIMGVCFLAAAIVNLSQTYLVQMSLTTFNGNFTPLNVGSIVVSLPMFVIVGILQLKQRKQTAPQDNGAAATAIRTYSRTYSHGTAACTAAHVNVAVRVAEIERALLEREPQQQQQQLAAA